MLIYIHLFIASLFWGLNVIVMKILLNEIPFLFLASLRVLLSCLCLYFYMKVKHIHREKIEISHVLMISLFGIYLNFFFTFCGMQSVKGVDNALINALSPSITLLISFFVLRNHLTKNEIIGVILSLFAFCLSIHFQFLSLKLGFYFMLLGSLCYMISHIYIQKNKLSHSFSLVFYQLLLGFLFLLIHALFLNQVNLSIFYHISFFYWILFIIISGIGFAYIQVIYMKAVNSIGALKTSFFLSFNPIITYIGSLLFLNEKIDYLHIVSFIILIISIVLANHSKNN